MSFGFLDVFHEKIGYIFAKIEDFSETYHAKSIWF